MKKVHLLVIKSFLGPFVLTFAIAVFILVMIPLIKYAEDIFGKGLDFNVIARLLFFFSVQTVTSALPLAVLLASLMTFGNLGERNELTALKAAGISFQKILLPIFVIVVGITYGAFEFNDKVIPYCNLKLYSLLYDVKQQKPAMEIRSGVYYNGIDGYSIKVQKPDPSKDIITQVMLYNHTGFRGNSDVILADSGRMYKLPEYQMLKLELDHGVNYSQVIDKQRDVNRNEHVRTYFEHCEILYDLSSFNMSRTKEELFAGNRSMLNVAELKDTMMKMSDEIGKKRLNFLEQMKVFFKFYPLDTAVHLPNPQLYEGTGILFSHFKPTEQRAIIQNAKNQIRSIQSFTDVYSKFTKQQSKNMRKMGIEYHFKYALAAACLVMFIMGAPLGAIVKKGGFGFPVLISILFYIIYYVLSIMGKKWAQEAIYSIPSGMWFSTIILIPVGFYFYYKAIHDSPVVDFSRIGNLFSKKSGLAIENTSSDVDSKKV